MKNLSHMTFLLFLLLLGSTAIISLSIKGWDYYLTPIDKRPFREDSSWMKPTGVYSHGLGIVGSLLVIIGVSTYSTRKRMRVLWKLGRLSWWLEFHIFLCLVGPILVVYHTTFKAGGIAAISLWTMLSVVSSGVIGRFLYVLIPRNLNGNELSLDEIKKELEMMASTLHSSPLGSTLIQTIDKAFETVPLPETLMQTFSTLIHLERLKHDLKRKVHGMISVVHIPHDLAVKLKATASARASLLQKSLVLSRVERLFHYWHVIHLPFTVIMFITLAAHVAVTILLGYRWIF